MLRPATYWVNQSEARPALTDLDPMGRTASIESYSNAFVRRGPCEVFNPIERSNLLRDTKLFLPVLRLAHYVTFRLIGTTRGGEY